MAEIVWSSSALARLQEIRAFVAMDKPDATERLAMRIVAMVEVLRQHPHAGRAGAVPGIRELIVGGTPYIILYRVEDQKVTINTIWHAAQQRRS
ncbi:type II toxin-antitoxin system RelE/ParE family toxin [Paracidobacterium acidisoli]|uniref:Type II toxin-antitoxin system RelE/ParE family toxin n=1 Tax=Paracidobacterium acidisoli TaxID=2303751 RepID=A0A372IL67_9BACT|nr:type II toxin-antitoxin system RelE/ParE family toxin [Paracidobacterium acidisoli]MBT9332264.1 type II toxin-antitoxin system RelE/ParE family toxin [Paracidobacterium acidisoli]